MSPFSANFSGHQPNNSLPLGLHTVIAKEIANRLLEINLPNKVSALEHGDLVSVFHYVPISHQPARVIQSKSLTTESHDRLTQRLWKFFSSSSTQSDHGFLDNQKTNNFDYVVSQLRYHQCNPTQLSQQYFSKLKLGGFLIGACFGPDTLVECRQAWQACGITLIPDNIPDMHDVGDLLLGNGFSDPVVDSETFSIPYDNADMLLADLSAFHETNWLPRHSERQGLLTPKLWRSFKEALNAILSKKSTISFEIVFFHGWKTEQPFKQKSNSAGEINIPLHLSGLK
jgi:hypothetical protein